MTKTMKILTKPRRTTLTVPSIAGSFSLGDHESAGGHVFGMISDRTFHTVVFQCWRDPRTPAHQWRQSWLRTWTDRVRLDSSNRDLITLTAIWDIMPGSETAEQLWHDGYALDDDSVLPVALLAMTFRRDGGGQKGAEAAAVDVGVRMGAILESLHESGLRAAPLKSTDLIGQIGSAYQPGVSLSRDVRWADLVPKGTDETRQHLSHPDRTRTISWLLMPREGSMLDVLLDRATDPVLAGSGLGRRRVSMTYRRIHDDNSTLLHRQMTAVSVVTPAHLQIDLPGLIGGLGHSPFPELAVAGRIAVRRAYDRQGELAAVTSGLGVVVPEHAVISDSPVFRDDFETKAS